MKRAKGIPGTKVARPLPIRLMPVCPAVCPADCPNLQGGVCGVAAGNIIGLPCPYEDPRWGESIRAMGAISPRRRDTDTHRSFYGRKI